jgi:hypothetical protein
VDDELIRYWKIYCRNQSNSNISLCYWKYFCSEIEEKLTEEFIAEWEKNQEYLDYLSDWEEYSNDI